MSSHRIGFCGAGQMARALASGFVRAGLVPPEQILAFDPIPAVLATFCEQVRGAITAKSNQHVRNSSDVIFLAVKPQNLPAVMQDLRSQETRSQENRSDVGGNPLFISIAAGVPLASLENGLGSSRIIRVMPNTPCLIGLGASCFSLSKGASREDGELVGKLMQSVGLAERVEEKLLDAVTGLSGSGPAFVYLVIEALSDGGVRMGIPRDVSLKLAAQTCLGAAQMVLQSGEHPAVLKDRVTSPGGTTIAGLQSLEQAAIRGALISAVESAARRATELGK